MTKSRLGHRSSTRPQRSLSLRGRVAVVAGATRGAGRGIARALGEAGATVYVTGRSAEGNRSDYNRPETIEETAEMITAAGGSAVPVRVGHTVESQVEALFQRVIRDSGRLDVLVNSIAGEDPRIAQCVPSGGRISPRPRPPCGTRFSPKHPGQLVELLKTGAEIQLEWLSNLSKRTKRFQAQLPPVKAVPHSRRKQGIAVR